MRTSPSTLSVPQELCPVYDAPPIHHAVEEARAAGISRLIVIAPPGETAVRRYLESDDRLETALRRQGQGFAGRKRTGSSGMEVRFAQQPEAQGFGAAILGARALVDQDAPFAVIQPLDLVLGGMPALAEMCDAYDPRRSAHMLGIETRTPVQTGHYGIRAAEAPIPGRQAPVTALVHPAAPQPRASGIGRFIFGPGIFAALETAQRTAGRDADTLPAAIAAAIGKDGVSAFAITGTSYNCSTADGLLTAALAVRAHRHLTLRIAAE